MEPNTALAWINLVLLIVGFVTLWFSFGRKMGLLQADLADGLRSIAALMNSYGILLGALSKKTLTASQVQEIQKPYLEHAKEAINQLLNRVKPGNPITASELDRLRAYVTRAQRGEMFNPLEAQEFYDLSKKLESEETYRTDIGAILLVGLAAFILGLVVGSSDGVSQK